MFKLVLFTDTEVTIALPRVAEGGEHGLLLGGVRSLRPRTTLPRVLVTPIRVPWCRDRLSRLLKAAIMVSTSAWNRFLSMRSRLRVAEAGAGSGLDCGSVGLETEVAEVMELILLSALMKLKSR